MKPYLIHIPKTGGTSIRAALGDEDLPRAWVGELETRHLPITHPATVAEMQRRGRCLPIAVVRHPLDRAVATYHWLRTSQTLPGAVFPLRDYAAGCGGAGEFWRELPAGWVRRWPHLWPQRWFLDGGAVGHLLRFDHLAEDWAELCAVHDLKHGPLPHLNASREHDWALELDSAAGARVSSIYADDFSIDGACRSW